MFSFMESEKSSKVITLVLECVKFIVSALIGYFGGNAMI